MSKIKLSYVLTTFNKLPYLETTLPYLIANKKSDEEIVIVDGGSSDGTKEYLSTLHEALKIDQFESTRDNGESHGTNKAMLLARGELVKIITDDDLFDFRVIQKCRNFMLQNGHIDITGFDGLSCRIGEKPQFEKTTYVTGYHEWQQHHTPFLFCGLSFMIRRSSLPYLGLFNCAYQIVDMEYSIRVSALKTQIAFYSGAGFVNLVNPDSNSQKFYKAIRAEQKRLAKTYPSIKANFKINNPLLLLKENLPLQALRKSIKKNNVNDSLRLYRDAVHVAHDLLSREDPATKKIFTPDGAVS